MATDVRSDGLDEQRRLELVLVANVGTAGRHKVADTEDLITGGGFALLLLDNATSAVALALRRPPGERLAALLLGVVNAVVRPVFVVLTLPFTILTLGLFLLVINAGMLGLVAAMFDGFTIDGFGSALLGAVIVSVTGWLASWLVGSRGRMKMIVQYQRFDR